MDDQPISDRDYDFRTEGVAQLDAGQVEVALANIASGKPHPYTNPRDGRHDAATAYVTALHERKLALRPQRDEGREYLDQMKAEKHEQAEQLRKQLVGQGFASFDVPEDVQDHDLDALRRHSLIQQGKLGQVLPDLQRDLARLGIGRNSQTAAFLQALELGAAQMANPDPVTGRTGIELTPELNNLVTSAALSLNKLVHDKTSEKYHAARATVDEEIRRDREARS